MKRTSKRKKSQAKIKTPKTSSSLSILHPDCAGIDIGSESHFVAVPADRDEECVREFASFTSDLYKLMDWLKRCKIKTVIMESTGVFWIPLYELLDENGFHVLLVNARHVKNVSAHKTDVLDCQWLQQLGTFGLLKGAFRPENDIVILRAYLRHRDNLIKNAAQHIQRMQKSLTQMNLQLHNVISDITGKTGVNIIRAIVAGNTDPTALAKFRDERCHNSEEVIRESLKGNYRKEHVFTLRHSLEMYDLYSHKIAECDAEIMSHVKALETIPLKDAQGQNVKEPNPKISKSKRKLKKHEYPRSLKDELIRMTGVDLTLISGIDVSSAIAIIGEIGIDMSQWKSAKHFASWLGLSPGNKVSGGKRLSGRTKDCANRASIILRMAANSLYNANSYLGAFLRRMKMRLGSPKAITACAHKIAKQVYLCLKYGRDYIEFTAARYESAFQEKQERNLIRKAKEMGYKIEKVASC